MFNLKFELKALLVFSLSETFNEKEGNKRVRYTELMT